MVRIAGLRKEFDGVAAVEDVDLEIFRGELFALLGGSGCGKSTLLRMVAGLESPTSGSIELDGRDILRLPAYRRPVNMMFQSYALFPHLTVEQNVAFGLRQDKLMADEIETRVSGLLQLVEMSRYRRRKPHQLSGGQQQRVALARSLSKNPSLLLLDEPMAALDKKLRMQMQLEIVDIIEGVGVTCIMVTHDQEEAMAMADRIAIMEAGRILQIGPPAEVYEYPNCRFAAEFLGSVNLFEGRVGGRERDHVVVESADLEESLHVSHGHETRVGADVAVAVRPEKVRVSSSRPDGAGNNRAQGVVEDLAYLGSHTVYYVRLATGVRVMALDINVTHAHERRFSWDDSVWVSWDAASGVVLES